MACALALAGLGPVPVVGMLLADIGADIVRVGGPPHRSGRDVGADRRPHDRMDVVNQGSTPSLITSGRWRGAIGPALDAVADMFVEGFQPGSSRAAGYRPGRAPGQTGRRLREPSPVYYSEGGAEPTITDAHAVLGVWKLRPIPKADRSR